VSIKGRDMTRGVKDLRVDRRKLEKELEPFRGDDILESRRLSEAYLMLSLECNLRCRVCAWWGTKGPCRKGSFLKRYRPALPELLLKRMADDIIAFKPSTVTFSGGEPLLNDAWYPLARHFKENGVKVSLTTNGMLLERHLDRVVSTVDEINLSLGGPPSIIGRIRGNPPRHVDQIFAGLKRLTRHKARHAGRPHLRILYTISDLSYRHMAELIRYTKTQKIEVDHYHFQHLMFIDPKTLKKQREILKKNFHIEKTALWEGYTLVPEKIDPGRLFLEMRRLKRYKNVSFSPDLRPQDIRAYYGGNRGAVHYAHFCTAPWHQINLMPNGDIYVCHDLFIGNVRKEPFTRIWNGPKIRKLRAYVMKDLFPGCKGCFYHYTDRRV